MTNSVAIDFETANAKRCSICSLGLVIVENRIITDRIYSLVKPIPNYYSFWATDIHGISYVDTIKAPNFFDIWPDILKKTKSLPFVAHNSPFDSACLKAIYEASEVIYPDFDFYCTLRAARQKLPNLENHKLSTVAQYFGYNLESHHHALADAKACAIIAIIATHIL